MMKAKVDDAGLLVPRSMLEGFDEVEIRVEDGRIVITPVRPDPITRLGQRPLATPERDASERHDDYLYQ
jgi:virulence-associated protein VagC